MGRAGSAASFGRGHGLGPATAASRLGVVDSVLVAFLLLPLFASDTFFPRSSSGCVVSGAAIAAASDTLGGGDSRATPGQHGLARAQHDDFSKTGSNHKKDKRPPNAAPTTTWGEEGRGGGLRLLLPQLLQLPGREAHLHRHASHDSGLAVREEKHVDWDNKKAPGKRRRLRRMGNAAKPAPSRATCPAARKTACPGVPDTVCVNLLNDTQNCGTCFNQCPFRVPCRDGKCVCPGSESICKDSFFNNFCTDLKTDVGNCGSCGNQCIDGARCVAGKCLCPKGTSACKSATYPPGECSDLTKDVQNCGKCGHSCPQGATCSSGTCRCPARSNTICDTVQDDGSTAPQCTNLKADTSNCGKCGNQCAAGKRCINGTCPCPRGQTVCSISGSPSCRNLETDAQNCGKCDIWCPDKVKCVGGECACPRGQSFCDDPQREASGFQGYCADLASNPSSCGGCARVCDHGVQCVKGKCQCPHGTTICIYPDAFPQVDVRCVDLSRDAQNCGACNTTCPPGAICSKGRCTCPKGKPLARCKNSQGQTCANLQTDPENCGDCGNSCNGGRCDAGRCVCRKPRARCSGTCGFMSEEYFFPFNCSYGSCVNVRNDPYNCGGCNKRCIPSWYTGDPTDDEWCCKGKCNPMNAFSCGQCGKKCNKGETCCFGEGRNTAYHYCADLSLDPQNCGTCGNYCLNDTGVGNCVKATCR